jgi:hypothetical protein
MDSSEFMGKCTTFLKKRMLGVRLFDRLGCKLDGLILWTGCQVRQQGRQLPSFPYLRTGIAAALSLARVWRSAPAFALKKP